MHSDPQERVTHCPDCQHGSGDKSWDKGGKSHLYRPQALGVVGLHYNRRVSQEETSPTTNSQVTRLYEKLEVMSVDFRQPGTRSRADFRAHLFPTVIKVSFGIVRSFIPCSDRICSTSRIASYARALGYPWMDTRPPTMDRFDFHIPDS